MSRAPRTAGVLVLAWTLLLTSPSAYADFGPTPRPAAPPAAPAPRATPTATVTPTATPTATPTVSAADAQRALTRQRAALSQENARLSASTTTATGLLQAYQQARRAAETSALTAGVEARKLAIAVRATDLSKARLGRYARSLYRNGMVDARMFLVASALTAPDNSRFLSDLGIAQHVGESQAEMLLSIQGAEQAQDAAATQSRRAADKQRQTAVRVAATKAAADRVVADLQARVELRRQAVALTAGALANAQHREAMLARAEAIARLRARPPEAAVQGALVPRPGATCKGKSTTGYLNGRLPPPALCPLWGTYLQLLRADAAAAFDAMSHDYAIAFGSPICVTDSYRSYAEQVSVELIKPELAAPAGHSNHGWGVALDLCDGVESFGTPTHRWLLDNSMRFGWFHPDWAEPTGSKPEPWHWEFAG